MPNPVWTHRAIAQISVLGTSFGAQIVNVHHFQATSLLDAPGTADDLMQTACATLVNEWITNCKSAYLGCLANSYNMVMVRGQVLERNGQWRHRLTPTEVATSGAGTAGGGFAGDENVSAGVLRWRTPIAGKKHRGRSYFAPLVDAWKNAGMLDALAVTALNAYRTVMLTRFTTPGTAPFNWAMTVYSRPYNFQEYGYVKGKGAARDWYWPPEYPGDATDINAGSVDPVIRSQRRRQIGVGA